MNIWVINQFAGTNTSGWGERHFYLSAYWVKAGHRVSILSGAYNHVFTRLPEAPHQYNYEDIEGRRFCWIRTPKYHAKSILRFWSFFVFSIKVLFASPEKLGRPDVILVSSMPIFPILSGYLLKKRFNAKRLIFEVRDIWPLTLTTIGGVSPKHPAVKLIGWFERFGYRHADHIVSVLPRMHLHVKQIMNREYPVHYIPNGLAHEVLHDEKLPDYIAAQIPSGKFIVGYVGAIGLANALEPFLKATTLLAGNEHIHFVIVGDGYDKEYLRSIAQGNSNVTFISKIKKDLVQDMLRRFDVCYIGWHNSELYRFGISANKNFDYMLAAKPVLDANNHIDDPIELSGGGILVEPGSPEAIRDGVLQLYRMSAEERALMGQKGKEFLEKYHSIPYLSEKYMGLFST